MNTKRILFVSPPYHCGVVECAGRWLPSQFVYLATAARRAGFEPVIFDAMGLWKSHAEIAGAIEDLRPDVVAVSAITATMPDALEVLRNARRAHPGVTTVIGGVHPTFMDREILEHSPEVDYVVRGEGELTLEELLACLAGGGDPANVRGLSFRRDGGVLRAPPRPLIRDLATLVPAWDLVDFAPYTYYVYPGSRLAIVNTSRGCNNICTFCSQQKFWNRSWRGRPAAHVVAELELLHGRGVDTVLFGDEYPTSDRGRWEAILDALIERGFGMRFLMETRVDDIVRDEDIMDKYRRAGFVHVYVGVEATDQATLDLVKKDTRVEQSKRALELLREHGFISETSFILGFPHETPETIRKTLELSLWYDPDFAHYLALTPWPYADLYEEVKSFVAVRDYSKYNLIDPVIKPAAMSLEEVDRAMIDCYRVFYAGKMRTIGGMSPEKRQYFLRSMKLIMGSSFITQKMGKLFGVSSCPAAMWEEPLATAVLP